MRSANHTSRGIAGSSFVLKGTLRNLMATMPPAQSKEAARKAQEKAGLDRGEEVGDLQARDQYRIAKPGRSKERPPGFPPAENSRAQEPKVKTAGKVNQEKHSSLSDLENEAGSMRHEESPERMNRPFQTGCWNSASRRENTDFRSFFGTKCRRPAGILFLFPPKAESSSLSARPLRFFERFADSNRSFYLSPTNC